MRPIISNTNAPTEKLAKWLVTEIKKLPPVKSFSVKNSYEFVEKIQNVQLENDERLVSFDVTALFPSIPIDVAISALDEHLIKHQVPDNKREIYIRSAKLCMNHNIFQFRGSYYRIEKGTAMGNSFSPLIAEFFMAKFEENLVKKNVLPRVWIRYVDDVFAVIKKNQGAQVLEVLNNQYDEINFTLEEEVDGELPVLDLKLKRVDGKIEISVYHKPTSTQRYITSDSHSPIQHKMAAFNSMVYRLCKLPLSVRNYMIERQYILETAKINGYNETHIERLIKKHSDKIKKSKLSTLFAQNRKRLKKETKRIVLTYDHRVSNKVATEMKKFG